MPIGQEEEQGQFAGLSMNIGAATIVLSSIPKTLQAAYSFSYKGPGQSVGVKFIVGDELLGTWTNTTEIIKSGGLVLPQSDTLIPIFGGVLQTINLEITGSSPVAQSPGKEWDITLQIWKTIDCTGLGNLIFEVVQLDYISYSVAQEFSGLTVTFTLL